MMESQLVNNAASNNKLFFYALCLSAYENDAKVKSLFHLDYLSHFTDTDGKSCFFGMVKVGGENAAYHAAKRLSKVKTRIENNECVILNDAGLNCLGEATVLNLTSIDGDASSDTNGNAAFRPHVDNVKLWYSVLSSYYTGQTISLLYRKAEETNWQTAETVTFTANHAQTLSSIGMANIDTKGSYEFKIEIANAEGTRYSVIETYMVYGKVWTAKYSNQYASYANAKTTTQNIYSADRLLVAKKDGVGSKLYTDEDCTIEAAQGFYVMNGYWYKYEYDTLDDRVEITTSNAVGNWPSDDPAYVPPVVNIPVSIINNSTAASLTSSSTMQLDSANFTIQADSSATANISGSITFTCNTEEGYTPYTYTQNFDLAPGATSTFDLPNLPFDSRLPDKAKLSYSGTATMNGSSKELSESYALEDYT